MEFGKISSKEYNFFFLNLDNSVAISYKLFKFGMVILDTITQGIVSQNFCLGPSSFFMLFRTLC